MKKLPSGHTDNIKRRLMQLLVDDVRMSTCKTLKADFVAVSVNAVKCFSSTTIIFRNAFAIEATKSAF